MFHKDIHILLFPEDPFFCRSDLLVAIHWILYVHSVYDGN